MQSYLNGFIEYILTQKRYSERTATLYKDAVARFYTYILPLGAENTREQLEVLKPLHIRSFVMESLKGGLSPRTVNMRISALSSYCTYLVKHDLLDDNPVHKVYRPKESRRLPEFYKKEDLSGYINKTENTECKENTGIENNYSAMRDRMIVTLLYATGMRRAEAVNLKVQDYDRSRKLFRITGKGAKVREIPVIPFLSEKIELYLQTRKSSYPNCLSNSFFLTDKGAPLYLSFVNIVVKRELAALKGFGGKKSPHLLRHSLATHLLNAGADLNSIKEVLGHSSLAATQVYTHNSFEQLKKIYITAHPRAKKGG